MLGVVWTSLEYTLIFERRENAERSKLITSTSEMLCCSSCSVHWRNSTPNTHISVLDEELSPHRDGESSDASKQKKKKTYQK